MGTPGLFIVMVIGLLAGGLGRLLLRGRPSRFAGLAAGVIGALAAPPVATAFGYPLTALWQLALAALAGAILLLTASVLLVRR
jgi:uncharacterized membrane protein YeaQ/YmgE (transglycosylase-associated protein family)